MASVVWVASDGDDDLVEFVEPPTPRKPTALAGPGPSTIANGQLQRESTASKKRPRSASPDSDIEILETPKAKIHKSSDTKTSPVGPSDELEDREEDHAVALALQAKWDEEDALAQRQAAETEEKSLRLIARLQKVDAKMAEKRQWLAQRNNVPDDGIVFKVVIDADGKTLEGDDDPDNAAQLALSFFASVHITSQSEFNCSLDLVKRDFEAALGGGLRLKTGNMMRI